MQGRGPAGLGDRAPQGLEVCRAGFLASGPCVWRVWHVASELLLGLRGSSWLGAESVCLAPRFVLRSLIVAPSSKKGRELRH